jgi:hypothetical protein
MAFRVPGAPRPGGRSAPAWFGTGKIGIIGTAPTTLPLAPWPDPSWTFWVHSSAVNMVPAGAPAAVFDLHPPHCFKEGRKNGFDNYYDWLKRTPTPVFMQRKYTEIPASIRFPKDEIQQCYPYEFGSQTAEMIGLALLYGATHIGFWGVEYADFEYTNLRANTLLWVGIAAGAGIQIVLPKQSKFLRNAHVEIEGHPKVTMELVGDYGYDTHSTPEKYARFKEQYQKTRTKVFMPRQEDLRPVLTPEAREAALMKRLADPAWRESIDTFTAEDALPPELVEMEARQRDAADIADVIAAVSKDDPHADPAALTMLVKATQELEADA